MATSNRNITVSKDEYALFGKALPYIAMLIGSGLLFMLGVLTRLGIYSQFKWGDTSITDSSQVITWMIILSGILLSALAWKLFSQRRGLYINYHATLTTVFAHIWLIMAIWEDAGDWIFGAPTLYAYFYGAGFFILTWCIRRWAFRDESNDNGTGGENPFDLIGLGEARVDGYNSKKTVNGAKFRLRLPLGKSIEDAKAKRASIAHIAGKPRSLVHISETDSGIEGQADITILNENPFKGINWWQGPDMPGQSIVSPITYATYDDGTRPELYIAGKNGASSQHFLTMGMPGTGKSKAWQVIYGTILNRTDVSVIYGDPAKGMQTGGALAAGLEWFAWTEDDCHEQIKAVMRAIPARTNYLTTKGLSHWQRNCGLNFLIFHLEEAARFSEVEDLVLLTEAARSAGISIVLSLQRADSTRIKTSARYNLGGNMCFGVKGKRDAEFGLSEYARSSGAEPHLWQDRFPGHHYIEAVGLDQRMAGHQVLTDWVDEGRLEQEVDNGRSIRSALDSTTVEALGSVYSSYREQVTSETTAWQEMRRNRGHDNTTLEFNTQSDLPFNVISYQASETRTVAIAKTNLQVTSEEKEQAELNLWNVILDLYDNGQESFSPSDLERIYTDRSKSWINKRLIAWVAQERLQSYSGMYRLPEQFQQ
jgi:hypothetical protein